MPGKCFQWIECEYPFILTKNFEGSDEEIQCTACHNIISSASGTSQQNIHAHPVLKVIICKNCYINISSIKFSNELCLWCGSSGIFVRCIQCSCHFCKVRIIL